jgi:hypothetical protein
LIVMDPPIKESDYTLMWQGDPEKQVIIAAIA